MPNLAPSHLEHLNRIPGLQTSERSWQMSVPGRELLGNKTIFGEDTLSCLQRANGTILIQCVDFFAEFLPGDYDEAPARLNNVEYDVEFVSRRNHHFNPKFSLQYLMHISVAPDQRPVPLRRSEAYPQCRQACLSLADGLPPLLQADASTQ